MALSKQNEHLIYEIMGLAGQAIDLQNRIRSMRARWDQNDVFNTLTDPDLAEHPDFSHLTKSELGNAVGALTGVDTELGDYVSGQVVNLLKLIG